MTRQLATGWLIDFLKTSPRKHATRQDCIAAAPFSKGAVDMASRDLLSHGVIERQAGHGAKCAACGHVKRSSVIWAIRPASAGMQGMGARKARGERRELERELGAS